MAVKRKGSRTIRQENQPAETEEILWLDEDDITPASALAPVPAPQKNRKGRLKRKAVRLLVKAATIVAAVTILVTVVGGVFVAHDNNMYPAVRDGDLCITYRLGGYYNGDVVAFEKDGGVTFGRVVGIEGDVVDIPETGGLIINGTTPYEVMYYPTNRQDPAREYPYTVQKGELFLLCDQREDAADSRTFGAVTKPLGKVVLQLRRRGF